MTRILMIAYQTFGQDNAIGARLKRHAEALAERGDSVDVICLGESSKQAFDSLNIMALPSVRYRGASAPRYVAHYLAFFLRAFVAATRSSMRRRYDVVIVISMPDVAVFAAIGTRFLGSKIILDITDTMPELYRDRFGIQMRDLGARLLMIEERVSAGAADLVLAVHEPHRGRLEAAGIESAKIRVVMNSPDPRIFGPLGASRPRRENFTLVHHGSLIRRLGLDTAIEAMRLVQPRIPRIGLEVFGKGDYLDHARALVERLGLTKTVLFHPPVAVEDLPKQLAIADVGLVPSHSNDATNLMLPAKLLEYAVLGIPVIASQLKTIEHYFGNEAIRYFKPEDPADLANAIVELYEHSDLRETLALRASEVVDTFNWNNQRQMLYKTIDSLLSNGARSH